MKQRIFLALLLFFTLKGMKRPLQEQPRDTPTGQELGGLAAKAQKLPPQQEPSVYEEMQARIQDPKERANLRKLPDEILSKILIDLAKEKVRGATEEQKLYNAIANIRAFMEVFPQFYSDVATTGKVISELAKRYALDEIKVAIALATKGAGLWLAALVNKDQKKINTVFLQLMSAAENNELAKIKFILAYVSAAATWQDAGKRTPLLVAAENGHVAVVDRLLQVPGIHVNAQNQQGFTALMFAAHKGHTAVVERLLQVPGINVNALNPWGLLTALMYAAQNGHAAVVDRLLQAPGIHVNAQTQHGFTAFMIAAENGHTAVVERLLQVPGINVNAQNQWGGTALTFAAQNGHAAVVDRLLQVPGINVNAQNQQGGTALMYAARKGDAAIVEQLLQAPGINVNLQTQQGFTALMFAAQNAHAAVVDRLLQVPGINVNARSTRGTALRVAQLSGSPHKDAIIKLLRDHGATE